MIRALAMSIGLLVAAGAVAQEAKPESTKLVGSWKLTKSSEKLPEGFQAVITVSKDGKFTSRVIIGGKLETATGTWKADGSKVNIEYTTGPAKGMKESMEIKTLTATELVTEDGKGKKDEYVRVKGVKVK